MKESVKQEIQILIDKLNLNCTLKKFKNKVNWNYISSNQKLSENFIREFQNRVNWEYISIYQKLSEDFIREFKNQINWSYISKYQNLPEDFIREFENRVNWEYISKYQKLSEDFIYEFQDKINWYYIINYQKLSPEFCKEFNLKISKYNWLYKTKEWKLDWIKNNTNYEVVDDQYIIAYKSVKLNGGSIFNRQFKYEIGNIYEDSHCDCNIDESNSFGLSAWDKKGALEYYNKGKLLKVKINIEDIGCIVPNHNNKIRCWKLTILEEVEK